MAPCPQKASDVHSANGVAVSKDGKVLYVVETEGHLLKSVRDPPSDRRVFVNLDDLTHNVVHIYPDGVKIDSRGQIYVGQNPRDAPLARFSCSTARGNARKLTLPSPGGADPSRIQPR